jgi:hypothetical protein
MNDVIGERRVQNGRRVELLARNGSANNGKDAGTNDRADAERRQRPRA